MWIRALGTLVAAAGLAVPLLASTPAAAHDGRYDGYYGRPIYPDHRHYVPPPRRVDWDYGYYRPRHPHYPPPVYYRPAPPPVYYPQPVYPGRPPVVVIGPPHLSFDFDLYAR